MQYEIHVTVKTDDVPKFRTDCSVIGVKPILIETEKNGVFDNQVMTSSKHLGDDYRMTLHGIYNNLKEMGYKIVRVKVEIFPLKTKHPEFIYYESHLRLKLEKNFNRDELIYLCDAYDFHLSKNLFKSTAGFDYQMITYRNYNISFEHFSEVIDKMKLKLYDFGIMYDKVEIEECIFDSNVSVDKNWL